jgi:hypothetical protein
MQRSAQRVWLRRHADIRQKARRLAHAIATARATSSSDGIPGKSAVNQLQNYLLGNSFIRVFSPGDGAEDSTVRPEHRVMVS